MCGAWVPAAHHADRSETPCASRERRAYRGLGRYLRRPRQGDVPNRAEVEPQPADREQEGAEDAERRGVAAQLVGRLVPGVEPAGSRSDDLGGKESDDTFGTRGRGGECMRPKASGHRWAAHLLSSERRWRRRSHRRRPGPRPRSSTTATRGQSTASAPPLDR